MNSVRSEPPRPTPPGSEPPGNGSLYVARQKIHPREVNGTFQFLRRFTLIGVLGAFYILCWVPWGDRQAILWDLPARRFHIL